ncbi:MAG: YdiU family protein [Clostridia bacterium]|nr:YdiU family protein [Clostridia bacterium]
MKTFKLENSYKNLPSKLYSEVKLSPVRSPELKAFNNALAIEMGLPIDFLQSEAGVSILAGNTSPEGGPLISQAYAGHQFGSFTMLGDGRAMLLGEHITPLGQRLDIQLKGSGKTPYSRGGDGRATLGPMLREYIISEAMHGLGIPTTRSLSVVSTGEAVIREKMLSGAVLTRVASSHIRVGTFEFIARWGTTEELKALADYTIRRHYPQLENEKNPYLSLLREVVRRQVELIVKWENVGFIHGVMNTDNMSISGETIDYGPCAFMDTFNPLTVFSSIDTNGRYAFGRQRHIAGWNLARFAETLLPLLDEDSSKALQLAQETLSQYGDQHRQRWLAQMQSKLGLVGDPSEDEVLINDLLDLMLKEKSDYTNTFRALTLNQPKETSLYGTKGFEKWYESWQKSLDRQSITRDESNRLMRSNNPSIIPRNHQVEAALESAVKNNDFTIMERLNTALVDPYAYSEDQLRYVDPPSKNGLQYRTYCGT